VSEKKEDLSNYDFDQESMYNNDQRFFALGVANDVAKSYTDIKDFLQHKYPDLQTHEPETINKIAITVAETWVQILIGRIMSSEMEEEETQNNLEWYPIGRSTGGH
jgi:hypothetical protein